MADGTGAGAGAAATAAAADGTGARVTPLTPPAAVALMGKGPCTTAPFSKAGACREIAVVDGLPPKIVYECCHMLAPKKWSIAAISGSPEYGKPGHVKEHLQSMLTLMGLHSEGRIPTSLRSAPALFFEMFSKHKPRVTKALQVMEEEEAAPDVAATDASLAIAAAAPAPMAEVAALPASAAPPGMLPLMDKEAASGPGKQLESFIKAPRMGGERLTGSGGGRGGAEEWARVPASAASISMRCSK